MIVKLVKIGNSQGIRIPRSLIEQCGLEKEVELHLQNETLIIKPKRKPRQGWEEEFKAMHANQDDDLLWPEFFDEWELEEWE